MAKVGARFGQTAAAMLGVLASAGARAESYEDAWRSAQTGPRPAIARARYLASTARTAVAIASGRPRLTLDAYASRNFDTDVYGPRLRDETTAQLILPLYQGGRLRAAAAAARADERAENERVQSAGLALAVDVADVYTAVREARALGAVAANEIDRLSAVARRLDAERQAGVVALTEAAECRARLAAARRDRVDARRREADAAARFEEVVGHPPGAELDPLAPVRLDLADIEASVRDGNPELRAWRHAIDAARHRVTAQRAFGRPTLSLVASASYGNTGMGLVDQSVVTLPGGVLQALGSPPRFPHQLGARGLLVLSVPLSRGGEVAAHTAQARAAQREAEAQAQAREAAIVAVARRSLARARAALTEQDFADAAMTDSRDALKGVDIARAVGERTEHDVLVASTDLAAAGRQRARAEREAAIEGVAALAAIGRLPESRPAAAVQRPPSGPVERSARSTDKLGFDLAGIAGSRITLPAGSGQRPLGYDLRGLG